MPPINDNAKHYLQILSMLKSKVLKLFNCFRPSNFRD